MLYTYLWRGGKRVTLRRYSILLFQQWSIMHVYALLVQWSYIDELMMRDKCISGIITLVTQCSVYV